MSKTHMPLQELVSVAEEGRLKKTKGALAEANAPFCKFPQAGLGVTSRAIAIYGDQNCKK
ncbi:MAG: hypothetical protein KJZ90_06055 [Rhodocyclaceae bacterium]|nr:hypothetical protein [Rhodocyclaceae bacterium]